MISPLEVFIAHDYYILPPAKMVLIRQIIQHYNPFAGFLICLLCFPLPLGAVPD
jgi:hypothetical protein